MCVPKATIHTINININPAYHCVYLIDLTSGRYVFLYFHTNKTHIFSLSSKNREYSDLHFAFKVVYPFPEKGAERGKPPGAAPTATSHANIRILESTPNPTW